MPGGSQGIDSPWYSEGASTVLLTLGHIFRPVRIILTLKRLVRNSILQLKILFLIIEKVVKKTHFRDSY